MGIGKAASGEQQGQRVLGLDEHDTYDCPVCRHGQIQPMALMDVYACSFCRHIFDLNLDQQTVHVVDSVQSMGWRWQGRRWQPLYQTHSDITLLLWLVGLALVVLPAGIVALGSYVFPPLEAPDGLNWSLAWAVGTLVSHGTIVGWLVAEHYQFPFYVMGKIRLQRLVDRLPA
ncbi:MAG: hypothetical protein WBG38_06790 [Nodosilinea sp.]